MSSRNVKKLKTKKKQDLTRRDSVNCIKIVTCKIDFWVHFGLKSFVSLREMPGKNIFDPDSPWGAQGLKPLFGVKMNQNRKMTITHTNIILSLWNLHGLLTHLKPFKKNLKIKIGSFFDLACKQP